MTETASVQRFVEEDGQVWRLRLSTPKANILDQQKIEAITGFFAEARDTPDLKVVLLDAEGPHFSFGASVEEHLPGQFEVMIPAFHRLFLEMLAAEVPIFAIVRGQCLGGGLELVSVCHRIFSHPEARFGQPEIVLGVFPPVASAFLTERMGRGAAEDICLSGRSIDASEAHRLGLVDDLSEDPGETALAWGRKHFLARSARSLRLAVRAVRFGLRRRFEDEIAALERLYLEDLMDTHDAVEGLQAFLAKRPPQWSNR